MPFDATAATRLPAAARMQPLSRDEVDIPRIRPILLSVEAGSTVTTFGDLFVVAHPAAPPELYDRFTGARVAVGGFNWPDPAADPAGPSRRGALELEPLPEPAPAEGVIDLRTRAS